ncbi:MAG TPA: polyprenol monophosphomannose synthase [Methylomirabilota bacterium]|nr:polyprenol monophosphomannose synthase [Methylomirabilota bacterium]
MSLPASLVIPTYNERDNLVPLLDAVRRAMAGRDLEIWIVDDDSPDRTWQAAAHYGDTHPEVRVVRRMNQRGLSGAVLEGFGRAGGDVLAVMDADLSHDPAILPRLVDAVRGGADLAVGSRRVPGGGAERWPWHRRQASDAATALARWWLRVPLADPMSGYFVLHRRVFERVREHLRPQGYKILLEIVCRAGPLDIVELPYVFRDRRQGVSKLSPRVGWEFLASVWALGRRSPQPRPTGGRRG